jgi:hypothetical protein
MGSEEMQSAKFRMQNAKWRRGLETLVTAERIYDQGHKEPKD